SPWHWSGYDVSLSAIALAREIQLRGPVRTRPDCWTDHDDTRVGVPNAYCCQLSRICCTEHGGHCIVSPHIHARDRAGHFSMNSAIVKLELLLEGLSLDINSIPSIDYKRDKYLHNDRHAISRELKKSVPQE